MVEDKMEYLTVEQTNKMILDVLNKKKAVKIPKVQTKNNMFNFKKE